MGKWLYKKIILYFEILLDIIFPKPHACNGCGRELREFNSFILCSSCMGRINHYTDEEGAVELHSRAYNTAFDSCIICCNYEDLVRDMIHRIKYKDKREIAITIAAIMADRIKEQKKDYDFIVPVPISRRKLKKRGYNHIGLIAEELKNNLNIPVLDCLTRIRDTKPQVLLSSHNRWYNVKGCFKCNERVDSKKLLLIDDIITTGATAHYCAKELKDLGATSVTIFSFAKSNLL